MNSQLSLAISDAPLSESPIAASRDPWTSHAAAREVTRSGTRAIQQNVCLGAVRMWPNCTSAELAGRINSDRWMTARRLPELRAAGLLKNGEARQCSVTGRLCLTWELA